MEKHGIRTKWLLDYYLLLFSFIELIIKCIECDSLSTYTYTAFISSKIHGS